MNKSKVIDLAKTSEDENVQSLYSAGFSEEQVIAIARLIIKILNTTTL